MCHFIHRTHILGNTTSGVDKLKNTFAFLETSKIVVLKKTTLQLYVKTFIEKINSGNLIM